jgi:hypothetical protein
MSNIYGVANPVLNASIGATVGGADVTLTAGSETTIFTFSNISSPTPGNYYPLLHCMPTALFGSSAPTALVFAFKIGNGSDVDTFTIEPGLLNNSGEHLFTFLLRGQNSGTSWIGAGSTINITGLATTNNATIKNVGSRAILQLIRGSD